MATLYSFDPNNYEKPVFEHCLKIAQDNKKWAESKRKELGGENWPQASEISQNMLREYLHESVEYMAIKNYKYLRLRSHSFGRSTAYPIDPQAFKLWTELTGKEPANRLTETANQ